MPDTLLPSSGIKIKLSEEKNSNTVQFSARNKKNEVIKLSPSFCVSVCTMYGDPYCC